MDTKDFNNLNKPRSKKLRPRIDLTAMVNISFLLIIFYMVSVELSKPKIMDLGLPDTGCGDGFNYGCGNSFYRTITLLLDENNKIISYRGLLEVPEEKSKTLGFGKDGIRNELLKQNERIIKQFGNRDRGLIVLIKPSKKSNFGNLVSILDEMAITNIQTYAIVNDFTPEESNLLAIN
ncbi:biopolymer transporter ExbD [Flavobacterium sp.]|uniref:ExbD/TolR family protein n=1 Tax=Flavobacterium sp. TaxID=239 RepID=UPI002610A9F8|nr:biopolymer transporter ExbD [Flavobacterium sp.]